MQKEIGDNITHDNIKEYLWKTLKSGQVVPGYELCVVRLMRNSDLLILRYGHGVLRNPDPRFVALQEFCKTRPDLQASPIIQLVQQV